MLLKNIKGMKFPDEYLTRFFFKEGLNKTKDKVLELGCGNGNNLMLFYEYGWDVTGVDFDKNMIFNAKSNFKHIKVENGLNNNFNFIKEDMLSYTKNHKNTKFNVLLFPSSLFYLSYENIIKLLSNIKRNNLLKGKSLLFLKVLTNGDYRYRRGNKIGPFTYKITESETGDKNAIITFLDEYQWVELLKNYFNFKMLNIYRLQFDNIQKGCKIFNSDIIIWGELK